MIVFTLNQQMAIWEKAGLLSEITKERLKIMLSSVRFEHTTPRSFVQRSTN